MIYNKDLISFAQVLRKNMTKEERHLWYDFLCNYSVKFKRQKVIDKYIADFYSAEAKLVIELDGNQHYEEKNYQNDLIRTEYIEQLGIKVIRIPNNQININFRGVCESIDEIVKEQIKNQIC